MIGKMTRTLARRVVSSVDDTGSLRGLNVPTELLDPRGLSAWAELELGDRALAEAIELSQYSPTQLLAERFEQSRRLLEGAKDLSR